jgi:hypothetical protein
MKLTMAVMLLFLVSAPAAIAGGQSIEQINQAESLDKAMDAANKLQATIKTISRTRLADCEKAFGNERFCSCIGEKLPVAWSFSDYVAITTRTKDTNGYDKLENDLKIAYDKVGPIRNECVATTTAP